MLSYILHDLVLQEEGDIGLKIIDGSDTVLNYFLGGWCLPCLSQSEKSSLGALVCSLFPTCMKNIPHLRSVDCAYEFKKTCLNLAG